MCAPLYATLWGWNIALSHMAISIAMGVCLVELALWRFHAVPCARPWNPEGANLSRLWWAYLIGFVLFTVTVPSYELRALESTAHVAAFTGAGLIGAGVLRVLSLRWRVVETDESAFAPGDILSLN
jgi:hypothetical protein